MNKVQQVLKVKLVNKVQQVLKVLMVIKDHKALQNQSSIDPQDYPKGDRSAQSLVRKPGDKD